MRDSAFPAAIEPLAEVVDIGTRRHRGSGTSRSSRPEKVVPYSVAELVAIQTGEKGDPWQLSLVQRDAVWKPMQVRYLLDSLLHGYPIGSLLLCSVKVGGHVRVERDGVRIAKEADAETWQLLDGQQRMNALGELFAAKNSSSGGYLLSLTVPRHLDDVAKRKGSLERDLRYILAPGEQDGTSEDRWHCLNVGRLHDARKRSLIPSVDALADTSPEDLLRIASSIDPECKFEKWQSALGDERDAAVKRIRQLLGAWHSASVPVVKLDLAGPTDVLQVFNRVNRTGTRVAGDDIFFAAVRTLWPDVEEHLLRVCHAASPGETKDTERLLPRIDALRLLARVASRKLKYADPVPLDVEQLRGEKGGKLREEMKQLCKPGSPFLVRVKAVSRFLIDKSGLGYGIRLLPNRLLDPVFAWAIEHKHFPRIEELRPAVDFLLGAAAFRYMSIFRYTFEHMAFATAVDGEHRELSFPTKAIVGKCRAHWGSLRDGTGRVANLSATGDEQKKRDFVNNNADLFLHIVQKVPFYLPEGKTVQREHIYPQAKISQMKWKGDDGRARSQRHPKAHNIYRAGNLCILDGEINRRASDLWPDEKFEQVYREDHWPAELYLLPKDKALLTTVCVELRKAGEERPTPERGLHLAKWIPKAMKHFESFVVQRENRLFKAIYARFPGAFLFAADEAPGTD